jgi:hypothetical protein
VLFPKMGRNDSSALRLAVVGTGFIGFFYTAFCYFESRFIVNAISGSGYEVLYSEVWLFSLEGALFAVLQVLFYARIAREESKFSIILWVGVISTMISVWIFKIDSISTLVYSLISITIALVIISTITETRFRGKS